MSISVTAKNHLKYKEVDIDFGANNTLTEKMKTDEITKRETDVFAADCLKFLESLTSKFVEKSPLKYDVVQIAKSLNPEIMCMTPEKGKKLFKSLVGNLVQLEADEADGVYAQYKRYLEMVVMKTVIGFCLKFNKRENRL